jgi:methylated-DNA-[protein]-cysteine S-methyltransferase
MDESIPLYYDYLQTEVGELVLAGSEDGLRHVFFYDGEHGKLPVSWIHEPVHLVDAVCQLKEYLAGKRRSFDLPLQPEGTSFQVNVWKALCDIPYGATITYGELAERVGSPQGYRAVGNANGKNPLVIIQPCHRVIAGGGKLGGFSAGIRRKKFLLSLEKGETKLF